MKRLALAAVLLSASTAHADVLSLRAEAHLGGAGGTGLGGDQQARDKAFFKGATGGTYGALVGLEIVFVDVWVEHHQYIASGGDFAGTWTQFMTGVDLDMEKRKPATDEEKKKGEKGKETSYLEAGIGIGYGVGTGQQVMPPLDAAQVTDKGFVVEGRFSAGMYLGAGIALGVTVPIEGGYFFKNGFANDASNQYYGLEGSLMFVARVKLKLK